MGNTYNYLKIVFLELWKENKSNLFVILIALVLISIPFGYAINSISLAFFLGITFFTFKKVNFKVEKRLLFPIALFLLMALSLVWTHDFSSSTKALYKGLPLLLIPIAFFIMPALHKEQKLKIIQIFSLAMVFFTIYCFLKATIRYIVTHNYDVFFYHELVTDDLNAIHVSVYSTVAIFYFLTKPVKTTLEKIAVGILIVFLILLSSKNIIVVFFGLIVVYFVKQYRLSKNNNWLKIIALLILLIGIFFNGKVKDRFWIEFHSSFTEKTINTEIGNDKEKVFNVSISQAWNQKTFQPNDYFPGTAFRVYQIRIFTEMLLEDPIFFTGYGLNATDFKISEKMSQHNLYNGYENKNFHNQYIQLFAELGVFGFLLIIYMVIINLKNALKTKDFIHIPFSILMISLFLTESFLSRQRGIIFFTMLYCLFNLKNKDSHNANQLFFL